MRMSPNHIRNKSDRLDSVGFGGLVGKGPTAKVTPLLRSKIGLVLRVTVLTLSKGKGHGYPHRTAPLPVILAT